MAVGYKQLIEEARTEIENLSADDALNEIGNDDTVFVDIRDVRELEREGMIPDAFHAPRGMLEFWFDPESPYHKDIFSSGKRLIFYCASGWRSALSTQTAQKMGLQNVCHLDGGFSAWKDAGGETAEKKRK
ncbi:MAG: rhodanese [Rhodospirillaceae bacterium]|nr:rhodanese [Rhodospirillaceae bacterium]